ncbi:MAG: hypothetical protein M0P94_00745 [Candidatus Absconditabacterales bacterium]|nr:hypothetical protein [Candidatus Absconditabacterales bacterium]
MKKKCIFSVFNKTDYFLANYSAHLASHMCLDLVFYVDDTSSYKLILDASKKIEKIFNIRIKVLEKKSNFFSWLSSISKIAKEENAEMIIMSVYQNNLVFFGESLWSRAQKLETPIMLLPENYMFEEIQNIVITADASMKIQKTGLVINFAKQFNSKIHIFKENVKNPVEQNKINTLSKNIALFLRKNKINFITISAKNQQKFTKNLCKYSVKNGDILVVEVDPGKIRKNTTQQFDILLHEKPVLLKKTKNFGIISWRS